MLSDRVDLQVIAEVPDGLEAIEKAQGLKPDLILMDIGLPGKNGIAAAKRILQVVPSSKIIFLTQESSPEVVQEAVNMGASGFVFKSQAADDLLAALDTVLQGRRFFSNKVNDDSSTGGNLSQGPVEG